MSIGSNSYTNALTVRGDTKSLSSLLLLKYHFLKIAWENLLTGVALEGQTQTATAELAAAHSLRLSQTFQSADSKVPKYLQLRTQIVQSLCFRGCQGHEQLRKWDIVQHSAPNHIQLSRNTCSALPFFSWQPQRLAPQQGVPPSSLYSSRQHSVSSFDMNLNSYASRLKLFSCAFCFLLSNCFQLRKILYGHFSNTGTLYRSVKETSASV